MQTRARGFTLIEAVVSIVVLGILFALALPMLSSGLWAFERAQQSLDVLTKLRYATERMAREIREVDYTGGAYQISSALTANTSTLTFTKADGTGVGLVQTGANVTTSYSTIAGGPFTLTDRATQLRFNFYDSAGAATVSTSAVAYVQIDLTLTNPAGASYSQRTRVGLRDRQ